MPKKTASRAVIKHLAASLKPPENQSLHVQNRNPRISLKTKDSPQNQSLQKRTFTPTEFTTGKEEQPRATMRDAGALR